MMMASYVEVIVPHSGARHGRRSVRLSVRLDPVGARQALRADPRPLELSDVLAASGFGGIWGGAPGLPKYAGRPCLPGPGHSGNREQPPRFLPITGVDAKHVADADSVVRTFNHANLVPRAEEALDKDSQIRSGTQRLREAPDEAFVVHPDAEPPARHARLRDLEDAGPDLPALADEGLVHVDPFGRQVLAELPILERSAHFPTTARLRRHMRRRPCRDPRALPDLPGRRPRDSPLGQRCGRLWATSRWRS